MCEVVPYMYTHRSQGACWCSFSISLHSFYTGVSLNLELGQHPASPSDCPTFASHRSKVIGVCLHLASSSSSSSFPCRSRNSNSHHCSILFSFCHPETNKRHLGRRSFIWKMATMRMACGWVYGTLIFWWWFMRPQAIVDSAILDLDLLS